MKTGGELWLPYINGQHCISLLRHSPFATAGKIDTVLQAHPEEEAAIQEYKILSTYLQALPVRSNNYGLIHYDFQLDNIFYEKETRSFQVIDFDDAIYSWYAHDIVTALDDFWDDDLNIHQPQVQAFVKGYTSLMPLTNEDLEQFPYFRRFATLYRFAKLLWALDGADMLDAPEWLTGLQSKLAHARDEARRRW